MAKTPYDMALLLDYMIPEETRKAQESFTTALTESWDGIGIATLDPAVWRFPEQFLRPVEEATAQMSEEIAAAYHKLSHLAEPYAHHIDLVDLGKYELDGKSSETIILNADFVNDIKDYLEDLQESPVRSLGEMIEFNKKHANEELPPEAPNQDHFMQAYEQNESPEDYERHLNHLRDVSRHQALGRAFAEHKVNVIIAPADSLLTAFAAGAGYPIASLPLSYLRYNGRPFGLAAVASANQERLLIQLQSAWEATFGKHKPPSAFDPPISTI